MEKRRVKYQDDLLQLHMFKDYSPGTFEYTTTVNKKSYCFVNTMFNFCGIEIELEKPDDYGRMYSIDGDHYFIEEWLEPLVPVVKTVPVVRYSREWWRDRLPLIKEFVDVGKISLNGLIVHNPTFTGQVENYKIKYPTMKLRTIDDIKAEYMHTVNDEGLIKFLQSLSMPCINKDMIDVFGTEIENHKTIVTPSNNLRYSREGVDNYGYHHKPYTYDRRWFV